MNNEFKKSKSNNETRYTLESMTAGATGSGSIAASAGSMGKVQKRGNILAQEAGKDKVDASKPRNFVAKNAKMGGAGAHKDKKKEQKQGAEKHKKPYMEALKQKIEYLKSKLNEAQGMAEGSGSKEKQKTPYRDINSPEYRDAADKQKQRMAKDKAAEPGKKMLAKQGMAESSDKTIWVKPSSNHTLIVVKSSSPDIEVGEEYDEGDLYNYANKFGYNVEQGVAEGSDSDAWGYGFRAFHKGATKNPFKPGSKEEREWDLGWESAQSRTWDKEQSVEEGASDFVGDAIESLRSSVPGLKQQDFLDELYMYIEDQYGQQAAEMMANAGQTSFDDWYDSYLDNPEQRTAESFSDIVKGVKRKVAGKEDPEQVVQRRYLDYVDASHADKDVSKTRNRYNKVRDIARKESLENKGAEEGSLNEGQYEMMMRNGQVKKFIAKDDADAKRIAAGHGAKSVIRLRGGVPAGKVAEGFEFEDAYGQGYSDGYDGKGYNSPFPIGSNEDDEYEDGYSSGRLDYNKMNRDLDEQGAAEGSSGDDEYGSAARDQYLKQRAYEKEYNKKKPSTPVKPVNKNKEQGMAEAEYNPDTFVGKNGTYKGYGITQEGPYQWGISSSLRKFSTLAAAKRHIDKNLVAEQSVAEGASDFVGDAIEALRSSVPGLNQHDFLDELYMYIDNQYGQRAAEMMANAGQASFDDWYDSYLDNPEQGVEEGAVKELMYDLKHMSDQEFFAQYKMSKSEARQQASSVSEVAPKGWEGTVKSMKKHKEIDNPYALTNYMKNKGYKSHKKEDAYMESLVDKLAALKKK